MKTQLVAVQPGFEDRVALVVNTTPDNGRGPDHYQLSATHPDRPGVVVRRPFEAPRGCRFEDLQNRNVWINELPLSWEQIVTALWVSGSDAYETVETFEATPVGIGEIRADKSRSAADWKPREALIELLRRIDGGDYPDMDALILSWRTRNKANEIGSFYSASSPDIHVTLGVLSRSIDMIHRNAVPE